MATSSHINYRPVVQVLTEAERKTWDDWTEHRIRCQLCTRTGPGFGNDTTTCAKGADILAAWREASRLLTKKLNEG